MYSTRAFWKKRPMNCKFDHSESLNFQMAPVPQFLTNFHKQGCILKLKISSFQPCIICEDLWWFIYESQFELTSIKFTKIKNIRVNKLWRQDVLFQNYVMMPLATSILFAQTPVVYDYPFNCRRTRSFRLQLDGAQKDFFVISIDFFR